MTGDGKYKAILLFGPPGSGKGTLGKVVGEAGQQVHVSSGDIFRSLSADSDEGKQVRNYLDEGKLVPDSLTIQIWRKHVEGLISAGDYDPARQLLLLDGIPRSKAQAEELKQSVEILKVVVLEVPDMEVLIDRLQERAEVQGRSDDQDRSVLERRMKVYQTQTAEVLGCYSESQIAKVNGDQSRLQVLRDVLGVVADLVTEAQDTSQVATL